MLRPKTTLLTAILVLFLTFPVWAGTFSGKAVTVLDGDTIDVMHQGRVERSRLEGMDCPEKRQAFANKAKQFTADLVMGKKVTAIAQRKDRYDRTLGYVILPDDRNLNRELVQAGLAWWYRQFSSDSSLGELENEARATRRGLWRDPHPVPPWEIRKGERSESERQNCGERID
jgi:endonuclease YncB( thermonuclease family)